MSDHRSRTFQWSLSGTITVDEATLKSAMLGFRLQAAPGEPEPTDEQNFEMQSELLAMLEGRAPVDLLRQYLQNAVIARVEPAVVSKIRQDLGDDALGSGDLTITEVGRGDGA